jgi:hypothetical protein
MKVLYVAKRWSGHDARLLMVHPKLPFLITVDDAMGKAASRAVPWVTRVKPAEISEVGWCSNGRASNRAAPCNR